MSSSMAVTSAMDAPMSSSLGAMGPLLRKLDSLLPPDYRLPKLLKDRIELLKADLEEISVALLEQSMVDSPNELAKYWMNEVRELCYDIEDFIDNMMSTHADAKMRSVQSYKVGRVKIAWLPKTRKPCTRAAKIAELRTLVREASERHDRYLDGCTSSSRYVFTGHARVPDAEDGKYLVGVDESKMKLIKWLTDSEEQQLKVVPIVGPAGVGKTTLAKQVYREVGEQFEYWAFVRASRKPDMRKLLGGILSQVQRHRRPSNFCTVQSLIDNLTKHLQDKRYFIVIDDLWETTAWDIVTSAFPEGTNCSRIVTTTEIEGIALECCNYQSNNILKMKPLGVEDSGKLLANLVFGPGHLCPEQFRGASDIIITKCAGLPLATTFVAGLLTTQPNNAELWQHVQECLCSTLSKNSTLEETLQEILKLSYNSLPHYLKTCLMYLSVYPEGYTLWKIDLVKHWIAEGFICTREGIDTGEVANSYFEELVTRGMIQPMDINYNGEVLSCTLHHIVLDLIALESAEERFITALDYSETIREHNINARRLSLHFKNTRYATKPTGLTLSKVRSICFFGILECVPTIVEFKHLRILFLEFWGDQQGSMTFNLTRICRLFQLRYLKISCDASVEVELPTQMRMLQYLETLIIDAAVSAVPLDIVNLPGLLHLSLGDKTDLPDEIGRIRSLRTLHCFDLGSNSEENILSLGDLMNLQDLHLTYCTEESNEHLKRNLTALSSSLGKLVNLKSVTLDPGASGTAIYHDVWSSMSSLPVFLQRLELLPPICIFSRLPECIGQLQKLYILKVVVSELLMEDMDILTGLPALTILSLYVRQPIVESIIFKRGAFLRLENFKFSCGVLPLAFEEEAFTNLQRLELSFNSHRGEKYDHLLPGIHYLSNLMEIVGTIGAAADADEPDRRAAESAFKEAIRKHPRFPSYDNVKRVDWVTEVYQLRTQEKDSSSGKQEILQKERKTHEGESSDDHSRVVVRETEEDTKQYVDSLYLELPFPSLSIETDRWVAAGADGPDRRATESAFKQAIHKHPMFSSHDNVKRVDWVTEEYQLRTKERDSPSEKHEILQLEHETNDGELLNDQSRFLVKETEEDTKQYVYSRICPFPATGSIFPSDQTKSETMWQMTLGGGGESMEHGPYPERVGEPDCCYYMRTGICRFGITCKFNHPPNRKMAVAAARVKGEYPYRVGQPECQYYIKTGTCKFGPTCKFHHPREKDAIAARAQLNALGYPLRPNEKECTYYLRTGQCKFASTCKFHHPEPSGTMVALPSSIYSPGLFATSPGQNIFPGAVTNCSLSRSASFIASPRWPGTSGSAPMFVPQGFVQVQGCKPYAAQKGSSSSDDQERAPVIAHYNGSHQSETTGMGDHGLFPSYQDGSVPLGVYAAQGEKIFPQRPDQRECISYMTTGDCKFGPVCMYNHPKERMVPAPSCALSSLGLPLRPGEPVCSSYSCYGICKFGPNCKFDHPMGTPVWSRNLTNSRISDSPALHYQLAPPPGHSEKLLDGGSGKPHRVSHSQQIPSGDGSTERGAS